MPIKETSNKEACNKREIDVTEADLPLSCPPRNKRVWDAHPRVYLPITEVGTVLCPYCGTTYRLQGLPAAPDQPALLSTLSD